MVYLFTCQGSFLSWAVPTVKARKIGILHFHFTLSRAMSLFSGKSFKKVQTTFGVISKDAEKS